MIKHLMKNIIILINLKMNYFKKLRYCSYKDC